MGGRKKGCVASNIFSHDKFMELFEATGNPREIKIIGQYKGMNYDIEYETKDGEKKFAKARVILNWKPKKERKKKNSNENNSRKLTHEEYMKRFEETGNPKNIKIIGEYNGMDKLLEYETEKGERKFAKAGTILNFKKDRELFGEKYPDLVKYFKNPEEAYQITCGVSCKKEFVCPICGSVFEQWVVDVPRYGLCCPYCSDTQSFPNKFIRNVILLKKEILEEFEFEYRPVWVGNKRYRYDAYFKYNGENFLVEMQGINHYQSSFKKDIKEIQENDKNKKVLALENGIKEENYFQIDARFSKIDYIRKSFEETKLQNIFNLTNNDYIQIQKMCEKNILKEICDYYNENPEELLVNMAKIFNMDKATIGIYLKKGTKLGLCNYEERRTCKTKVKVINLKSNEEHICKSVIECVDYFNNKLKIKVSQTQLRRYIDGVKELDGFKFELIGKRTKRYKGGSAISDKKLNEKRRKERDKNRKRKYVKRKQGNKP